MCGRASVSFFQDGVQFVGGGGWENGKGEGEGGASTGRHRYRNRVLLEYGTSAGYSYLGHAVLRGLRGASAETQDSNEASRQSASPAMLTFFSSHRA